MKRRNLIRHIEKHGCHLDREGRKHSIYRNPENGRCVAVPRHREIKETLARVICDQLGIVRP
ncbi:MAG: addiction module toxin, HicA family [Planctomycetaceae bacterium]|nr:addiction module toxin, HicA family [Planctomycetaceae bacterium]